MKIKTLVLITVLGGLLALVYVACNKSTPTQPQTTLAPAQTEVAKQAEPNPADAATPTTPPIKPVSVSVANDESHSAPNELLGIIPGAIYTTESTCDGTNVNSFETKQDVYLDGGPARIGSAGLPPGEYYVQITETNGTTVLGTSIGMLDETPIVVDENGEFHQCYQLWAILHTLTSAQGYDDSHNGIYKVWVSQYKPFVESQCKTDNFNVGGATPCTLTCPADVTVECDQIIDPNDPLFVTGSPETNCPATPTWSDVVEEGDCAQEKIITRTWSVADGLGGTISCAQTITVFDTKAPVLSGCPDPVGGSYDCLSAVPAPPTVTATDLCDTQVDVVYEQTESNPGSSCNNTIARTWTATDDCGNIASCSQTITVNDATPPEITCPADMTIECDATDDLTKAGTATATDNCDQSVTITHTDEETAGDCPQEMTIKRTWKAEDDCGNSVTCVQILTVQDTKAPAITCPANVTIECDASTDPTNTGTATATDNCDQSPTITSSDKVIDGKCAYDKTIERTWTATDACGNSSSCTQIISIVDTTPPVVECPDPITECLKGINGNQIEFTATATDNCDEEVVPTCTPASGSYFKAGVWTVTCSATDDCGNTGDCSFTITIKSAKICGEKFYDTDLDGNKDAGEPGVSGVKINLVGTDKEGNAVSMTTYTNVNGIYCFEGLPLGSYAVKEVLPGNYAPTTETSGNVNVTECVDYTGPIFGDVCLGAGDGHTKGYWSNKNGENTMNDAPDGVNPELAMLRSLCLVNANGSGFNPTTYAAFKSWLQNATSVNMAYMLSAQLAAMELNVEAGFVNVNSLVYAPGCGNTGPGYNFISIFDLLEAAKDALCAEGYTLSGNPNRAAQECLKNALDKANNNMNFVQPYPCPPMY